MSFVSITLEFIVYKNLIIMTLKAQATLESSITQLQDELHTKTAELDRLHTDMKQALTQTSTLKQVLLIAKSVAVIL